MQEFDDAFRHYRSAGHEVREELYRTSKRFPIDEHRQLVSLLTESFRPDLFSGLRGAGSGSTRPIFVVGMPRSGTTLVERIPGSHADVFGAGELIHIDRLASQLLLKSSTDTSDDLCGRLSSGILSEVADSYLARLSDLDESTPRVVDKMPENFLHLGLITLAFPNAVIIHCDRDARDVYLSCYTQLFHTTRLQSISCDLAMLGAYYREYRRLMNHWEAVLPTPIHRVSYERLVAEREPVIRDLVEACGLPWDASCLEFHRRQDSVRTASAAQVRQPLYQRSSGRWKRFSTHLDPLNRALAGRPETFNDNGNSE